VDANTSWYDIPNAWSAVEIQYQAFANSGSLTLWLDDVQKQSLTFIDNDTRAITDVRLGAQGIETGTRGTLYFDDFESRRFSYIGTLTVLRQAQHKPGVDDPQATPPVLRTASRSPNPTMKTMDVHANYKASDLGRAGRGRKENENGLGREVRETVFDL
jgi:hypothetical protein